MNFESAYKRAKEEGRFLRRDGWSLSRPSVTFENGEWIDAFGRPFEWSNADLNARIDADDWFVVSEAT